MSDVGERVSRAYWDAYWAAREAGDYGHEHTIGLLAVWDLARQHEAVAS